MGCEEEARRVRAERVQWLYRYLDACRLERLYEEEVRALRADACRVTANLSGMPGGASDGQALPRAVERIDAARVRAEEQLSVCGAVRREVAAVLETIPAADDYELMRRRYLLGQTWREVGKAMGYCIRQVRRKHDKIVDGLKMSTNVP